MTAAPPMVASHAATPVQPNGARLAGSAKMPDPIIPPTTRAVAVQKPKGRVARVSFAMDGETVSATIRKQGAGTPDQAGGDDWSSRMALSSIRPLSEDGGEGDVS